MAELQLRAQRRAVTGKKVRALRREGYVPAHLYGPGVSSTPLQVPVREMETVLRRTTASTLVTLALEGAPTRRVLVRDVQRHPVGEQPLHVDFFALAMDEPVRTAIPLHFVGEAPAVTQLDGTLVHELDAVEIEALPTDLPSRLDVDLSQLTELHSAVHVRDLPVPPGVTILTGADLTIVNVAPPRIEREEEPEAAAEAEAPAPAAPPAEETTE